MCVGFGIKEQDKIAQNHLGAPEMVIARGFLMKLLATPKSHFSRKVRLLLDHLELPYELVDVGNVAKNSSQHFGGNPVMSVPVLEDGATWMIESDHIAGYLVKTYDGQDRYAVLADDVDQLNARAVMNGVMANEVKLILSARTGLDPRQHEYFLKAESSIRQCLAWLNGRPDLLHEDRLTYTHFHFISMWSHLELYGLIQLNYRHLEKAAAWIGPLERVRLSAPD